MDRPPKADDAARWRISLRLSTRTIKPLLTALLFLALPRTITSTQDVRLSSYYPSPNGLYNQMLTTGNTYLAAVSGSGYLAEIGGTASVADPDAALVVENGSVAIGTASTNGFLGPPGYQTSVSPHGLYIGGGVPGGQGQIELDNANGQYAKISMAPTKFQFWASDQIGVGVGSLAYGNRHEIMRIQNGATQINGTVTSQNQTMPLTISGPLILNGSGGTVAHSCTLVQSNACECTPDYYGCLAMVGCCIEHLGCGPCGQPTCGCQVQINLPWPFPSFSFGPAPPSNCPYSNCSALEAFTCYGQNTATCPSGTNAIGGGGWCQNVYLGLDNLDIPSGSWGSWPASNGWNFGCANPTGQGVGYQINTYALCCQDAAQAGSSGTPPPPACSANGSSCSSNAACCSGSCSPDTNTCQATCVSAGGTCGSASPCCSGLVCGTGGTCETCRGTNSTCSIPSDCCSNICSGNSCLGGQGTPCNTGSDCASGTCNSSGQCACGNSGAGCGSNSDCCAGYNCQSHACASCGGSGSSCTSGPECCSGTCNPPSSGSGPGSCQ